MPSRPYPCTVTTIRTWSRNDCSACDAPPLTVVDGKCGGSGSGCVTTYSDAPAAPAAAAAMRSVWRSSAPPWNAMKPNAAAQLDALDGARLGERPPEPVSRSRLGAVLGGLARIVELHRSLARGLARLASCIARSLAARSARTRRSSCHR